MTGRGRPSVGPVITVRIPPDLLARLDAEAARQGITRAELVRDIVKEKLG